MKDYDEPFFRAGRMLSPTRPRGPSDPNYQPLIYELTNRKPSNGAERKVNLLLYDGAGEDYINPERVIEFARYVLYASAIVFLVDPYNLRIGEQQKRRSAYSIIQSIIYLFENYHGLETGNRLKLIPIAITLSKSDLIKDLFSVESRSYSFLTETTYKDGLKLHEIQAIDKEVRNFISEYEGYRLIQTAQMFPEVSFFAVSSTGYSVSADGRFPKIEPIRCLDPVLWILYKLGIIEADGISLDSQNEKREVLPYKGESAG